MAILWRSYILRMITNYLSMPKNKHSPFGQSVSFPVNVTIMIGTTGLFVDATGLQSLVIWSQYIPEGHEVALHPPTIS